MIDFIGVKIALFFDGTVLVCLRDSKPGLRFAGMWDFPGGGRENNEDPIECIIREVAEEFSITLKPDSIVWQKEYPAMHDPDLHAYFMVAKITQQDVDSIRFGEEGQEWKFMSADEFLSRNDVVPQLKGRLQDYFRLR